MKLWVRHEMKCNSFGLNIAYPLTKSMGARSSRVSVSTKVRITDPVRIINLMNCPLTKGHYCGKHIQIMTSWYQLILGQIWKPAVKSTWLAVMRITKHGYRVSLCKTSAFSIVLNLYEPRAKRTNFEIYIPEIDELIDHGSFYHCNKRVLIVSTYYVNIETRVATI